MCVKITIHNEEILLLTIMSVAIIELCNGPKNTRCERQKEKYFYNKLTDTNGDTAF